MEVDLLTGCPSDAMVMQLARKKTRMKRSNGHIYSRFSNLINTIKYMNLWKTRFCID